MSSAPPTAARTAIIDVGVFDGQQVSPPSTVVLDSELITSDSSPRQGDTIVDGRGLTLLPGLIDAHVHLHGPQTLDACAAWGVTTVLDMASRPPSLVDSLRGRAGTSDLRSANSPASAPGSPQTTVMGFDSSTSLRTVQDADDFVQQRIDEHSDYIKVIVEDPETRGSIALDPDTVTAAHRHGLRVFAHATTTGAYQLAATAGVDVLTHAPIDADADADAELIALLRGRSIACVPTLTMMQAITALGRPVERAAAAYRHASEAVRAMHAAGVPVAAGTDANATPGSPAPSRTARRSTTSSRCWSTPGSARFRRYKRPPLFLRSCSTSPTGEPSPPGCGLTCCWWTATPRTTSQPPPWCGRCGSPASECADPSPRWPVRCVRQGRGRRAVAGTGQPADDYQALYLQTRGGARPGRRRRHRALPCLDAVLYLIGVPREVEDADAADEREGAPAS